MTSGQRNSTLAIIALMHSDGIWMSNTFSLQIQWMRNERKRFVWEIVSKRFSQTQRKREITAFLRWFTVECHSIRFNSISFQFSMRILSFSLHEIAFHIDFNAHGGFVQWMVSSHRTKAPYRPPVNMNQVKPFTLVSDKSLAKPKYDFRFAKRMCEFSKKRWILQEISRWLSPAFGDFADWSQVYWRWVRLTGSLLGFFLSRFRLLSSWWTTRWLNSPWKRCIQSDSTKSFPK